MINIWRRASNLLLFGDYYPFTPFLRNLEQWVAWQFDCPEKDQGLIQAIRLPPEDTISIRPNAILPVSAYHLENVETGERMDISGKDLIRNGLSLTLSKRSGGRIMS